VDRSVPATVRVLLVVGDDDVRELARHLLERAGCRVLVAAGEAEALDVAESAAIDVLLIEVAPSLDGRSVATRLNHRTPGFAVVYLSGWFDHPHFAISPGETVVKVPFSGDDLMQAIDLVRRRAPAAR